MGLNQVRRVAGESDENREVRLQALRTKKVLDPGSVPLELEVSVLVTVVSFTLTCHLIVTGTDPGRGDAVMPIMSVYRLPQGQYGYSGHVVNLPQDVASFVQSLPRPFLLNWMSLSSGRRGPTRAIGTSVSDVQWCTELSSDWSHTTSTTTLSQITCINPVLL